MKNVKTILLSAIVILLLATLPFAVLADVSVTIDGQKIAGTNWNVVEGFSDQFTATSTTVKANNSCTSPEHTITITNESGKAGTLIFTCVKADGSNGDFTVKKGDTSLTPNGNVYTVNNFQIDEVVTIKIKANTGTSGNYVTATLSGVSFQPNEDVNIMFCPDPQGIITYKVGEVTIDKETPIPVETNSAVTYEIVANSNADYVFAGWSWSGTDGNGNAISGYYSATQTAIRSAGTTCTVTPRGQYTLTPIVSYYPSSKGDTAPFRADGGYWWNWETAFAAAAKGDKQVVLLVDYTLTKNRADNGAPSTGNGSYVTFDSSGNPTFIIPEGFTFLAPRAAGQESIASDALEDNLAHANFTTWESDNRYAMDPNIYQGLLLTVPANFTVNNNGRIILGGTFVCGKNSYFAGTTLAQSYSGAEGNTHSDIKLDGTINMGNGSVLSCLGFITGSGNIDAKGSDAEIYQPFTIIDFRGGNYVAGAAGKAPGGGTNLSTGAAVSGGEDVIAPFLRYTMQNIRTTINIEGGNYMYGYCDMYAQGKHNLTTAVIIGDAEQGGLINLESGTLLTSQYKHENRVKHYDAFEGGNVNDGTRGGINGWGCYDVGRTHLSITGDASLGDLALKVKVSSSLTVPMHLNTVTFPVPYNYNITLAGGEFTIPYSMMLLPGATMTVEDDAKLIIGNGTDEIRFMVMDGLFDHTLNGKQYSSQTTSYEYTTDYTYPKTSELQDAKLSGTAQLILKGGHLEVKSNVKFGGLVQTDGTAGTQVTFNGTSGCDIRVGLVGTGGNSFNWAGATTRTLPARLMNGAGDYVDMTANNVYKGAVDENNAITNYNYVLYTSSSNKSTTQTKYEFSKEHFDQSLASNKAVCDNCDTCKLAYGNEKARCVCNIFSDILVSGMWYDYTLTVKEEGKNDVVYYHLNNKLYNSEKEVVSHTIPEGYQAKVTSGKPEDVTMTSSGTTLTFNSVALTGDTVVTVSMSCDHAQKTPHEEVPVECPNPGVKAYWTCDTCGKNFSDEACTTEIVDFEAWKKDENGGMIPVTGHTFDQDTGKCTCGIFKIYASSLQAGDSLKLYFYVRASHVDLENGVYEAKIVHTKGNGEQVEKVRGENYWILVENGENDLYRFYYDGIAAKEMADTMEVTIYKNGVAVSNTAEESVEGYADRYLTLGLQNPTNDVNVRLKTTLVDLLRYGAASQTYFKYNTENLVDWEKHKGAESENIVPGVATDFDDGYFYGGNVTLESELYYTFYLYETALGEPYTVSYIDHYGKEHTSSGTVNSQNAAKGANNEQLYGIRVTGLSIADGAQDITCTVTINGVEHSQTASVAGYLNGVVNGTFTDDVALQAVAQALLNFINSAHAYFNDGVGAPF